MNSMDRKTPTGIHGSAAEKSGKKRKASSPPGKDATTWARMGSTPPRWPTAMTARMIIPAMASTNWKKSVMATPHIPASVEYTPTTTSSTSVMPHVPPGMPPRPANTVSSSTVIIAPVTHPWMMLLTRSAMYTARKPLRNAAGLPP